MCCISFLSHYIRQWITIKIKIKYWPQDFIVGNIIHDTIYQYFTSMLNPVPNIWYSFLVGDIITLPYLPIFHLHAESSASYLICIFSEWHIILPYLPILHQTSPHDHCWIWCPIFDMCFLAHNILHQYHPTNPNIPNTESAPQYFLYISWWVT